MQLKTYAWTNPASAVAKNIDLGFVPSAVWITNITDGQQYYWDENFTDGYVLDVDAGSMSTSQGVTPLNQSAGFLSEISAFTAANPGVITVADGSLFSAGDTIVVTQIADDQSGSSLNTEYPIASISGNALTTGTNTSSYSAYVSGGVAYRKTDSAGNPVSFSNSAIHGVALGTTAVGGNSDSMSMLALGPDPVN